MISRDEIAKRFYKITTDTTKALYGDAVIESWDALTEYNKNDFLAQADYMLSELTKAEARGVVLACGELIDISNQEKFHVLRDMVHKCNELKAKYQKIAEA